MWAHSIVVGRRAHNPKVRGSKLSAWHLQRSGNFCMPVCFYIINMIFSVYSSPYNRNEMLKGKPLASRLGRRACQATGAPSPAYEAPAKQ